ncbi:single-stranded DNA-binding protein [Cellulomonas humilata]|uniref:Single-stranded DNA-binding protein n=1 Tax=Cellulomonas humilata TaxID=144055 RepID=A0A7Y6DZG6_9CELL|nr:R3H domain-containing nucleic acid-binding protein [Cellulomonas humilata]NUU19014.1 single-stranded DNA-binding protein [Cellulomonas humilata]
MTSTQPDAPVETTSTKRLEEEGEIAADYLEELLDIADLDGDIDIDIDHGRAAVEIVSEDPADLSLRRLAGPDGEVLDALQELTRLAVQAKTGERSRLMLDVAGYRSARRAELVTVATEAISRVKESGQAVALDAMNPFERKVVHDAVAAAGMSSDSDGVEPNRHVVIRPA